MQIVAQASVAVNDRTLDVFLFCAISGEEIPFLAGSLSILVPG